MPTIEMKPLKDVIPKYVNDAKPGKKFGSIKLADDTKYLYPASMNGQFSEGTPVKVGLKTENWKDGPVEIITFKEATANYGSPPKQNTRQRMDPADARGAFITVILQSYIRAGKVSLNRDAIRIAREEIAAGYDMSFSPQRRDDMNDEIPY